MFEAKKSFDENLAAYKTECEKLDAECAKIFFDNINLLLAHGAERDARSEFNKKVKAALEALPPMDAKA